MKPNPEKTAELLREKASAIPQVADEGPCREATLLYEAADTIESLVREKAKLEALVAEFGEVASAAAYHARRTEQAASDAGRKAAYINQKAMNYFDPSYRKGDFV